MYKFILTIIVLTIAPVANAQDLNIVIPYKEDVSKAGAGVCFKVDKTLKVSYILTCNHLFEHNIPNYPTACKIQFHNKNYKAEAIAGSHELDIALVKVNAVLIQATLANENATPGELVHHEGPTSGPGRGFVLPYQREYKEPMMWFHAKQLTAIEGDSGSAIYNEKNEVVAILAGRMTQDKKSEARGSPIENIKVFLVTQGFEEYKLIKPKLEKK